jgi:integrase
MSVTIRPYPKGSGLQVDINLRLADGQPYRERKRLDPATLVIVLLGGDAGLRMGEMLGLEWTDLDLQARRMCVLRSEWKGEVTTPKGKRLRYVPMTQRLAAALRDHRHMISKRVLCQADDGQPLTAKGIQKKIEKAAKRANAVTPRPVHILRHTFCSHLAMRGATACPSCNWLDTSRSKSRSGYAPESSSDRGGDCATRRRAGT